MIFPIGDDNIKGGYKPYVSYTFIALNILIFVAEVFAAMNHMGDITAPYDAVPLHIMSGDELHTIVSYMFLHGGFMHIFGNMLFLWIFADNIEAIIGNVHFAFFYLMGGIISCFGHIALVPGSEIPMVGASGAISAVTGAYVVCFPKSRIKMLFLLGFRKFYLGALYFFGFWFFEQMTGVLGFSGDSNTAWGAHIGGFVFGALYAWIVFRKKARTRTASS